jgi:hypothetical protein
MPRASWAVAIDVVSSSPAIELPTRVAELTPAIPTIPTAAINTTNVRQIAANAVDAR